MKKAIAVMVSLILLISGFSLTAVAAVPSYTAAYATPTVDGVVNASEYGAAVPFNKSNLSLFYYNSANEDPTGANADYPDITYSFAWNEKGLYVGITSLASKTDIANGKFQIDLSPEKKISDGKRGIFFTFKKIGDSSTISIARHNYQNNGSKRVDENITRRDGVQGVVTQVGDRWNFEVFLPISELQVTAVASGASGNFSKLTMKAGTWGVGCYYVGNDGGYTSTQGAGANSFDPQSGEGELIEYYNNLVLAPAGNTPNPGGNTSNSNNSSGSSSSDAGTVSRPNGNTSGSGFNTGTASRPDGNTSGSTAESDGSSDVDSADDLPVDSQPSDVSQEPDAPTESSDDVNTPVKKKNSVLLPILIVAAVVLAAAVAGVVIYLVKNKKATPANSDTTDEWSGKNDR